MVEKNGPKIELNIPATFVKFMEENCLIDEIDGDLIRGV